MIFITFSSRSLSVLFYKARHEAMLIINQTYSYDTGSGIVVEPRTKYGWYDPS